MSDPLELPLPASDNRSTSMPPRLTAAGQVWDAAVSAGGAVIAIFRCTQLLLDWR